MSQQHPTHNYFGENIPLKAWEEDKTHYCIIKNSGHVMVIQPSDGRDDDQVVLSVDQIAQLYEATRSAQ